MATSFFFPFLNYLVLFSFLDFVGDRGKLCVPGARESAWRRADVGQGVVRQLLVVEPPCSLLVGPKASMKTAWVYGGLNLLHLLRLCLETML